MYRNVTIIEFMKVVEESIMESLDSQNLEDQSYIKYHFILS